MMIVNVFFSEESNCSDSKVSADKRLDYSLIKHCRSDSHSIHFHSFLSYLSSLFVCKDDLNQVTLQHSGTTLDFNKLFQSVMLYCFCLIILDLFYNNQSC